jgi:predicted ATPase
VRERLRRWRFYHAFPTHRGAPARRLAPGVRTRAISQSGADLAPALLTILEQGDDLALLEAVREGLDGAELKIDADIERAVFEVTLRIGRMRPMRAAELSEGTIQYLSLLAALMSVDPPELLVFNEPETSLHARLLPPLAKLLAAAGERSQIWVTTHSSELAEAMLDAAGARLFELELRGTETRVRTRDAGQAGG